MNYVYILQSNQPPTLVYQSSDPANAQAWANAAETLKRPGETIVITRTKHATDQHTSILPSTQSNPTPPHLTTLYTIWQEPRPNTWEPVTTCLSPKAARHRAREIAKAGIHALVTITIPYINWDSKNHRRRTRTSKPAP